MKRYNYRLFTIKQGKITDVVGSFIASADSDFKATILEEAPKLIPDGATAVHATYYHAPDYTLVNVPLSGNQWGFLTIDDRPIALEDKNYYHFDAVKE